VKTAAVYIRVSTEEQTEYSPDAQLKEALKYAKTHDMALSEDHIYIDEGISGKSTKNRSAFNRMIGTAKTKPRPFDVILLWKFSRFARNREDSIVYKSMLRRQLGIDVISITENIGDDKLSVLMEALIEAMDEYYSINLAEEVKKGMTEKAMRGEYQTAPPLGYAKLPGMQLVIIEEEAKYVRLIFDWYLSGLSFFAIANRLNAMGFLTKKGNKIDSRSVEYILNNPVYKGYARWTPTGKTVGSRIYDSRDTLTVKSCHEPIIPEELFDLANERLSLRRNRKKSTVRPAETAMHYLSGILKCGSCGSPLSYSKANNGFQCIKYTHGACSASHFIKAGRIEKAVLVELDRIGMNGIFSKVEKCPTDMGEDTELIRKEIEDVRRKLNRAKQAFLSGVDTLSEYESCKSTLLVEKNKKELELKKLTEAGNRLPAEPEEILGINSVLTSNAPVSRKSAALREIIERIEFSRQQNSITIFLYQ
jgi:DNA invertase Pin-like site-specific DNA recombinase